MLDPLFLCPILVHQDYIHEQNGPRMRGEERGRAEDVLQVRRVVLCWLCGRPAPAVIEPISNNKTQIPLTAEAPLFFAAVFMSRVRA